MLMTAFHADAEALVRALRQGGYEAYFAGGCVRDMVMGIAPQDVDIATAARPEQVLALFPGACPVGAAFGVVVVRVGSAHYEVATFRADLGYSDGRHPDAVAFCSARDDVLRRDFTINGMLYDPITERVIDWVGGQEDIRARTVRTIGDADTRFEEDKLRLLRAIRFAARLDYKIDSATYDAMVRQAAGLKEVSAERVRDELVKILTGAHAGRALRLMHDARLLSAMLPEAAAMAGVAQPPQFHPEGDVFEHTCMMFDKAGRLSPELAMGILLHDVGKPATQSFAERIRFNEHDREGAGLAGAICRRLRFSNEQIVRIVSLVANHMRFATAPRMRLSKLKMLLAMPHFEDHLELHRLDCIASHGKLDVYRFVQEKMGAFSQEELAPEPLVNGDDLLKMGYQPGPVFGEILSAVWEEQLEGNLRTRDEAVGWIMHKFGDSGRAPDSGCDRRRAL